MQAATRWRQLTIGSEQGTAEHQQSVFPPVDLQAECDLVIEARCNLLLVGSLSATNAMLAALKPHLRGPVRQCTPKTGVPLPQPREGTLVLLNVAKLDGKQQAELLQWMDRLDDRLRVQIVSTASEPLFTLVEDGRFLADLYYRLNIVRMDLTPSDEANP